MGSSDSDNDEDHIPQQAASRKNGSKKPKAAKAKASGAKRGRKKRPKDCPKRPLSAYNIFFKEKRKEITGSLTAPEIISLAEEKSGQEKNSIKGVNLFKALAMIISKDWNTLPPDQKSVYEDKAKEEMAKYQVVLGEYRLRKEKEAEDEAKAQKEKEEAAAAAAEMNMKSSAAAAAAQQPAAGFPSGYAAQFASNGMAGIGGGPYGGGFNGGALPGGIGHPYGASAGLQQLSENSAGMGDPQHAALQQQQQQQQLQHLMALQQLQQMNHFAPQQQIPFGFGDGGFAANNFASSLGGNPSAGLLGNQPGGAAQSQEAAALGMGALGGRSAAMGENSNFMALLQQQQKSQQSNLGQHAGHSASSAMGGLPGQGNSSYLAGLNQGAMGGTGALPQGSNTREEKPSENK